MLNTYFKIAWRNILRNKISSALNIGGLAVGLAVSFLLMLYVQNEFSFDRFHKLDRRLYQVFKSQPRNGEIVTKNITPQPLAQALQKNFAEVERTARLSENMTVLVKTGDKALKVNTVAADPSFLDLFDFQLTYGTLSKALAGTNSIVLTQSVAEALFGTTDPVGQTVAFNNQFPLTVSAVIDNHLANSSFTFNAIISMESFLVQQPWLKDSGWDNYAYATYILLKSSVSSSAFNKKIENLIGSYYPPDKTVKLFAYPFSRLHLYGEFKNGVNTGGKIEYVKLFFWLAIGILGIACINFMNLATARSERRAREVGVRKAMGARRTVLIKQFLGESVMMALSAFGFALLLLLVLVPAFNQVFGLSIQIPFDHPEAWLAAITIVLITGLLAGSYPALILSSFQPVKVLKGQIVSATASIKPRQLLVVVQFTFAIAMIILSLMIYKQIDYIKNRPAGYTREGLIELPADGRLSSEFESFRRDAISAGAIIDGTLISESINGVTSATWENNWPGQLPGENKIPIDCIATTYHFVDTYQLQLVAGRDFDKGRPADSTAIILNEAAVKLMRLNDPIGQKIKWMNEQRTVIGIVKNFVLGSPYEPVKPAILGFVKDWAGNIGLRLNPDLPASRSLTILQQLYKRYNADYPFEYRFTEDSFGTKLQNEKLLGGMSLSFTCFAVFISCLGLIGLASFSAEQRRKEISIRKIMGASATQLWLMLSQGFVRLVIISFVIATCISLYIVDRWLDQYTYHTGIGLAVFGVALLASVFICLVAVSWQAIRAALVNPVKSIRND
jgi:putative ABC transport system permease protein